MRRFAATISMTLAVLCGACSGGSSNSTAHIAPPPAASAVPTVTFARTTVRIGDAADAPAIEVEVAATSAQSERGLGYRDTLPNDAGMIFDLHGARIPTFWMKGMRFALDMVWIGADRRVASVSANVPPQPGAPDESLVRYSPRTPVAYVLELNAGAAARLGFTPGVPLSFVLP